VSPLDMATAYGVFAARGMKPPTVPIVRVLDSKGQVLEDHTGGSLKRSVQRVLKEEVADNVTDILQGVLESGGTAAGKGIGRPAAGKTGTAQDNKDAWFVGYTPRLTAAVWLGYADPLPDGTVPTMDENSPVSRGRGLHGVTGGSLPAAIWRKFMVAATAGQDTGTFAEPTGFPGRILHDELEQTTTTGATSSTSSTSSSTTSTTEAETTTSTTASTTTTTAPPTTSTTAADPPIN
jgi:penicillin-binding protein 1A